MMNNNESFIWPVNIWTEYEFTIKELAEKVINLIPWCKSKIIYEDLPSDDPKQRRANNKLAKEKLWWEPTVQLDDGLGKTIDYFRKFL